jgi:2-dehydropantoate 2-reductase
MDALSSIHIVGAGGIGCAVGHSLARAGVRVTFIEADENKLAWGRRQGVAIAGREAQPADFATFRSWQPDPGVPVLLCTKCYDNAAVLERLSESAVLVPIQNGFDPALETRPAHVEGVASFVSECEPGRTLTRITRGGKLHLGVNRAAGADDERSLTERVAQLAHLLRRAPFPVVVVPDVRPFKYTKLMYNAALSPLASAAGIDNGEILSQRRIRALFFALLRENHAILSSAGLALGKIGPLEPATVARILGRPWLAHLLAWAFYPSLRGAYCSMFRDLPNGRTEVEFYNRRLIDLAGGGPCPLNTLVYERIKRMEVERTPPSLAALEPLLAAFEKTTSSRERASFQSIGVDPRAKAG